MSHASSTLSRLWSRASLWSRDAAKLSRAFIQEARQNTGTTTTVADVFRNVVVQQARQDSNHVAASVLSFQQQWGLMQYHGFFNYWRQRFQHQLPQQLQTIAGGSASMSSTDATTTAAAAVPGLITNNTNNAASVAQVAFMITATMRKELSDSLGYTAEQIKGLTPMEASLILHHKIVPDDREQKLPGLMQAYEQEQERLQQEAAAAAKVAAEEELVAAKQQQIVMEQQRQQAKEEEEAAAAAAAASEQQPAPIPIAAATGGIPSTDIGIRNTQPATALSSQQQPTEGMAKLEATTPSSSSVGDAPFKVDTPPPPPPPAQASSDSDYNKNQTRLGSFVDSMENNVNRKGEPPMGTFVGSMESNLSQGQDPMGTFVGSMESNLSEGQEPLGSFVDSMVELADSEQEWYEIVEMRDSDHSEVPVGLFSSKEEAEMALDLKRMFAERRAQEDIHNQDNLPTTTYKIQTTIK